MGNILYKYGWNRSLDNKFMNLYCQYVCISGARQNTFNETHLVQKVVYKFRCCSSNNALPYPLVTMQGKVLEI